MTEVPEYVPMLVRGVTSTPRDGGCLVQIANWLADPQSWTDEPLCVEPILAECAIRINDAVDDEARHSLALLAPRLAGTVITDPDTALDVMIRLAQWVKAHPIPVTVVSGGNTEHWVGESLHIQLLTPTLVADGPTAHQWLVDLIDHYDEITNVNTTPRVPVQRWLELKELMGQ